MHDLHSDYPIAPEKTEIKWNILYGYSKKVKSLDNISIGGVKKRLPSLNNKNEYVIHYRSLQLYIVRVKTNKNL